MPGAGTNGVRLWEFATAKGIGVQRPFYYLLPYVQHAETWKKQQSAKFSADSTVWPGLAGVGLQSERPADGVQEFAARRLGVGAIRGYGSERRLARQGGRI